MLTSPVSVCASTASHSVAAAPPFPGTWASGISVGSNPLQLLLGARHVPAAGSELTARALPMGALKSGSKEHQAHKDRWFGFGGGAESRAVAMAQLPGEKGALAGHRAVVEFP